MKSPVNNGLCQNSGTYGVAVAATAGAPSNTITRSARYVAMIKSCSMTKAVFLAWRMNLWVGEKTVE